MIKHLIYDIEEIEPYINWLYFFHAWGLNGKSSKERENMREEALQLLSSWQGKYHTHALFGIFDANSDGDDLLLGDVRIPMLRQQHPTEVGGPNLCLADFVRPLASGIADRVGAFCTTVDGEVTSAYKHDEYGALLSQVVSDRLAEATAEKMHQEVRKNYWGYAPNEHLSIDQLHREEYQGIRPAIGYPSLPDVSVNFLLDRLLDMSQVNIRLTESGMMVPHSSVSGFMFAHPQSRYFDLGKIGEDQLVDYARRRGLPKELVRRFLQSKLIKQ